MTNNRTSKTLKGADGSNNNNNNATSANISSPASFLNHHANRLKSKIVSGAAGAGSSASGATNTGNQSQLLLSNLNSPLAGGASLNAANAHNQSSKQPLFSTHWNTQRNNLIILANASAIELYFLCIEDESDAEKLCTKCSEKFFLNMSLSDTILQAPLIASCIQILSKLAMKYPNLARISVRHLTDFLTEPSPILLKQYKHIIEKLTLKADNNGAGNKQTTDLKSATLKNLPPDARFNTPNKAYRSLERNPTISYKYDPMSYSKSTRIFEFIRDLTIDCLCL